MRELKQPVVTQCYTRIAVVKASLETSVVMSTTKVYPWPLSSSTGQCLALPKMTDKMADAVTRCIGTEHLKMARTLQENVWSGGQN